MLATFLRVAFSCLAIFSFFALCSLATILFNKTIALIFLKISIPFAIIGLLLFIIFAIFVFGKKDHDDDE